MAITSIAELREIAGGIEVDIPGFSVNEVLTFKIKRPSLLEMAATEKIPNPLLNTAAQLFRGGTKEQIDDMKKDAGEEFKAFAETVRCVVEAALVQPTYKDLNDNNIELTDVQLLYIYNFVQSGVDQLKSFRKEQGNS